jgi:hypothetical protein
MLFATATLAAKAAISIEHDEPKCGAVQHEKHVHSNRLDREHGCNENKPNPVRTRTNQKRKLQ